MRVFTTKWFAKFAKRERLTDKSLSEAVRRADSRMIDADLGGGLIKQRVARTGRGRSGGYRVLIAYRFGKRMVFLYGFAKNEQENISKEELTTLKEIAAAWLKASETQIKKAIDEGSIREINYDQ